MDHQSPQPLSLRRDPVDEELGFQQQRQQQELQQQLLKQKQDREVLLRAIRRRQQILKQRGLRSAGRRAFKSYVTHQDLPQPNSQSGFMTTTVDVGSFEGTIQSPFYSPTSRSFQFRDTTRSVQFTPLQATFSSSMAPVVIIEGKDYAYNPCISWMFSNLSDWFGKYMVKFRGSQSYRQGPSRPDIREVLFSSLATFVALICVNWFNRLSIGRNIPANLYLIGSFGATAVLIYHAIDSPMAQPPNVLIGHVLSALVGVSIGQLQSLLPDPFTSIIPPLAVACAIGLMGLTNTMHPPGGATALIALVGGDSVSNLGFSFVLHPVATGVLIMLACALIFNNLSPSRSYPRYWLARM